MVFLLIALYICAMQFRVNLASRQIHVQNNACKSKALASMSNLKVRRALNTNATFYGAPFL